MVVLYTHCFLICLLGFPALYVQWNGELLLCSVPAPPSSPSRVGGVFLPMFPPSMELMTIGVGQTFLLVHNSFKSSILEQFFSCLRSHKDLQQIRAKTGPQSLCSISANSRLVILVTQNALYQCQHSDLAPNQVVQNLPMISLNTDNLTSSLSSFNSEHCWKNDT